MCYAAGGGGTQKPHPIINYDDLGSNLAVNNI